ncbi:MAG: hypothetical protein IKR49_03905, partial [Clostridia bacterium]|nr:hypothetical protein [Clostridia bacterium]
MLGVGVVVVLFLGSFLRRIFCGLRSVSGFFRLFGCFLGFFGLFLGFLSLFLGFLGSFRRFLLGADDFFRCLRESSLVCRLGQQRVRILERVRVLGFLTLLK